MILENFLREKATSKIGILFEGDHYNLVFALPSEAKDYITKIATYSIQSNGFRLSSSVSKYLFENTIIMDLQDIEVPRTVEGFLKLIMAVKITSMSELLTEILKFILNI
uniref:Uncharacterized protein n=1 Tax=Rhizophagus irregularis (strain DAOM 181602 / DAOM 197198 / MUCL 43194) TaxID=747089 RepID=U9T2Y2_RHIID